MPAVIIQFSNWAKAVLLTYLATAQWQSTDEQITYRLVYSYTNLIQKLAVNLAT